jgi:hypothetical protein
MAQISLLQSKNILGIVILVLFGIVVSVLSEARGENDFEVKTYLDRDSGGWADKISDYAFLVERDGCKIQWNAVEEKNGNRWLVVRRVCGITFSEQAPIHRAILNQIQARWAINTFKYISWGSFCTKTDWSWCIQIAEASLKSKEFIEHCKKYPRTETVSTNHIFIKLANQTNCYKQLSAILKEFGVTINVKTVQKVFSLRLKEAPFYNQLKSLNVSGNPRVIYDVGESYFYINN